MLIRQKKNKKGNTRKKKEKLFTQNLCLDEKFLL